MIEQKAGDRDPISIPYKFWVLDFGIALVWSDGLKAISSWRVFSSLDSLT